MNKQQKYFKSDKGKKALKKAMRKYHQTERGKNLLDKSHKKYIKTEKGRLTISKIDKRYRLKNPEKTKARNFIRNLLKTSDFTRDICSICGTDKNVEFHHENYDLPYFGYWLCKEHHNEIHNLVK